MRNCKNGPLVFIRILFGCFQISSKILRILTGENSYAIGRSRTNRNFSQLFASIPISTNPIGHQLGYHPKTIKSLIPDGCRDFESEFSESDIKAKKRCSEVSGRDPRHIWGASIEANASEGFSASDRRGFSGNSGFLGSTLLGKGFCTLRA